MRHSDRRWRQGDPVGQKQFVLRIEPRRRVALVADEQIGVYFDPLLGEAGQRPARRTEPTFPLGVSARIPAFTSKKSVTGIWRTRRFSSGLELTALRVVFALAEPAEFQLVGTDKGDHRSRPAVPRFHLHADVRTLRAEIRNRRGSVSWAAAG